MDNADLGFSYEMETVDRGALLNDAVDQLDQLRGYLGGTASGTGESPEGALARALLTDTAEFADLPVVHKITDRDFLSRDLPIPVRFSQLARASNFYWIYFPVALFPQLNWAFNRLEIAVEFNSGDPTLDARPKPYQILPQKQFQTLLEATNRLEVGLDENFEFSVRPGAVEVPVGQGTAKLEAGVGVKAAVEMGVVAGPVVYRLKKARIDHTATGLEKVFWRLDGAEFFQEDSPPIIVIAQVPKHVKAVKIAGALQAYRRFDFMNAGLRQAVQELPGVLRRFFEGGAPLRDEASWDITPQL